MKFLSIFLISLVLVSCTPAIAEMAETPTIPIPSPSPTAIPTLTPVPDFVVVGAGDIAECSNDGDELTASLLDNIPGTVFTTGDNAYPKGVAEDFTNCYDPSWGRHKARTYPSPGNHDYRTNDAKGYFEYFGSQAGDPTKGYYSYDLGVWHIVVLNSNIPVEVGSPQEQWLRADLAAHPAVCTLAYWHHPLFSSGFKHGGDSDMRPLWQALYDYGADVVLNGHEHNYERFALQDPQGTADPARGIRQFVIGTGGGKPYEFGEPVANSEIRNTGTYGVLKLILHPASYSWEFVPETDGTFTDSGTAPCVTP